MELEPPKIRISNKLKCKHIKCERVAVRNGYCSECLQMPTLSYCNECSEVYETRRWRK